MTSSEGVRFFVDENLPRRLTGFLSKLKVPIESVARGIGDKEIISIVGEYGSRGVWITQDLAARDDHRVEILESGISVAWLHSGSDPPLKSAFLTLSFVYRFWSLIESSGVPLYFNVREVSAARGPSAVVSTRTKL